MSPALARNACPMETFERRMGMEGWVHFHQVLPAEALPRLRADVEHVYRLRRAVQERNGVTVGLEGTAHHVLGEGTSLDAFANDLPLYDEIRRWFGGQIILLNFGATLHLPSTTPYTLKPHRDVRAWSGGYRLSLNMLVMLDDFTAENGATLMMPGSHLVEELPGRPEFEAQSRPLLGQAGDIVLFDSLLVHAGAPNRSTAPRRALTLCFGRPFMKPQMDWPRFLSAEAQAKLNDTGRQLLGFHARVPATVEEYYQPPERWAFKPDQK